LEPHAVKFRRTPLIIASSLTATLAVGAVATDLTVEHIAQQHLVRAAACGLHATGPVTATLTDTLAGLGAVTGSLGTVRITADGVNRGGTNMNIDAVLYNVTTHGATDGGKATATIPYSTLQQRLGSATSGMTVGTDGTNLILSGTIGGMGLPVTVETSISTTANSVTMTPTNVVFLGQSIPIGSLASMPGGSGLAGGLKPYTFSLPALAAGAHLTAAVPSSTGLSLLLSIPRTTGLAQSLGAPTGPACSGAKA
jgi:hypothetical protein